MIRQLQSQWGVFENLWRGTRVSTRMCPSCRALVSVSDKTCTFCGSRLGWVPSGFGKFLQNLLPRYAPVSFSLMAINFVFFLFIFASERDQSLQDLRRFLLGGSARSLLSWGASMGFLVFEGQWWRLISAIFIHIGVIHLLFNTYALIFIGPLLEDLLGKERFFVFYLTTGALGFLISALYYPPYYPTAGASGAIFGMIGAGIVLAKRWSTWGSVLGQQLVHWALYGFVYGLMLGANNAAHLGGLATGAFLAFTLPNPNRVPSNEGALHWRLLYWACVIATTASLLLAVVGRVLARGRF
ncbi:MAG: rhomboid family intramembrane serine protease [Acidobacteriota bacterium]